jgi:hypothetical protein
LLENPRADRIASSPPPPPPLPPQALSAAAAGNRAPPAPTTAAEYGDDGTVGRLPAAGWLGDVDEKAKAHPRLAPGHGLAPASSLAEGAAASGGGDAVRASRQSTGRHAHSRSGDSTTSGASDNSGGEGRGGVAAGGLRATDIHRGESNGSGLNGGLHNSGDTRLDGPVADRRRSRNGVAVTPCAAATGPVMWWAMAAGVVAGAGVFARFSFVLFAAPVVAATAVAFLTVLWRGGPGLVRRWAKLHVLAVSTLAAVSGLAGACAVNVWADSVFFGHRAGGALASRGTGWVVAPANNFAYNLDPANLAVHGLHPRTNHLLVNGHLMYGPVWLPALVASVWIVGRALVAGLRRGCPPAAWAGGQGGAPRNGTTARGRLGSGGEGDAGAAGSAARRSASPSRVHPTGSGLQPASRPASPAAARGEGGVVRRAAGGAGATAVARKAAQPDGVEAGAAATAERRHLAADVAPASDDVAIVAAAGGLLFSLAAISSAPHQEPRFLLPLMTPLAVLVAASPRLGRQLPALPAWCTHATVVRLAVAVWLLFNAVVAGFFGVLHQAGVARGLAALHTHRGLGWQRSHEREVTVMALGVYNVPHVLLAPPADAPWPRLSLSHPDDWVAPWCRAGIHGAPASTSRDMTPAAALRGPLVDVPDDLIGPAVRAWAARRADRWPSAQPGVASVVGGAASPSDAATLQRTAPTTSIVSMVAAAGAALARAAQRGQAGSAAEQLRSPPAVSHASGRAADDSSDEARPRDRLCVLSSTSLWSEVHAALWAVGAQVHMQADSTALDWEWASTGASARAAGDAVATGAQRDGGATPTAGGVAPTQPPPLECVARAAGAHVSMENAPAAWEEVGVVVTCCV